MLEAYRTARAARVPIARTTGALFALAALGSPLAGQAPPAPGAETLYVRTNVMIAMRDGVRLNTEIFAPKAAREPLPILLLRTPYGVGPNRIRAVSSPYKELHDDGYIFVFQDIRGRYKSEGQFVMMRAPRVPDDPRGVDEASDAFDTIDWLVKNVPNNNGRVGIFGVSYDGWTTAMALLDPHPAFRAASPQASPSDMWMGDDFHHNGAFRLSYGFEYAALMEATKEQKPFTFDRYDTYEWYLKLGPLANVNAKYLRGQIPTWNDFVAHPNYDRFWQRQTILNYLNKSVTVPTLNVAGWWDQEDFYGPITIYRALEKQDRNNLNFFVAGPWNHGGWNRPEGNKLGNIDFGGPTSLHFRERIQAPFFRCHLKGRCDRAQPEAITFEPGANEWRTWDSWPPKSGIAQRKLYFQPGGRLSFDAPVRGARSEVRGDGGEGTTRHAPRPTDLPDVVLLSSGSEVALILAAQQKLEAQGIAASVVSMPSHELFARQDAAYRDSVLPRGVPRIAIEAAHPMSWYRWVGDNGVVLGLERFGASAPYARIYEELGLTVDKIVETARQVVGQ